MKPLTPLTPLLKAKLALRKIYLKAKFKNQGKL